MINKFQTGQKITFTAIATILIPLGVGLLNSSVVTGLILIVLGIGSLIVRELFKSA